MSSPNINNAIIVGCTLAYISVILFSVDGERLTSFICKVNNLLKNIFISFPKRTPLAGGFKCGKINTECHE